MRLKFLDFATFVTGTGQTVAALSAHKVNRRTHAMRALPVLTEFPQQSELSR